MKTIAAGKLKDQCLKVIDRVAATREPVVVTKRGRPVVRIVPYIETPPKARTLAGSILAERGNPFTTGEEWDADV